MTGLPRAISRKLKSLIVAISVFVCALAAPMVGMAEAAGAVHQPALVRLDTDMLQRAEAPLPGGDSGKGYGLSYQEHDREACGPSRDCIPQGLSEPVGQTIPGATALPEDPGDPVTRADWHAAPPSPVPISRI